MRQPGELDVDSLGTSLAIYGYSDSARLGVALALQLAGAHPDRVKIEDLAKLTESTYASTGRALRLLAAGGIARSTRGPRGGWRLSRPAGYIKLLDVIGPLQRNPGQSRPSFQDHVAEVRWSAQHPLDRLVEDAKAGAIVELGRVTLAQLIEGYPDPGTTALQEAEAQPRVTA